VKRILQIFLAIIPLVVSFSTSDAVLSIRMFALAVFIGVILIVFVVKNKPFYKSIVFHPVMLLYSILIVSYFLSAINNGFGAESIHVISKMILFYVFLIISSHIIMDYGFIVLLKPILVFSILLSVSYVIQVIGFYTGLDFINIETENIEVNNFSSTMGNRNLLVSIQFLILPFILFLNKIGTRNYKIISFVSIILFFVILVFIMSRAVLLSVILFIGVIIIMQIRNIKLKDYLMICAFLTIIVLSSYVILKQTNRDDLFLQKINSVINPPEEDARFKLYSTTTELIKNNMILGVGPGNWKREIWNYGLYFDSLGKVFAQRPHNDFLWVFAEGGIIAFLSYILIFLILLKDSYSLYKSSKKEDRVLFLFLFATLLGYVLISMLDFPIERISHNIIFMLICSVIVVQKIRMDVINPERLPGFYKITLLAISFYIIYFSYNRYCSEIHVANAMQNKIIGNNDFVIKEISEAYDPDYYDIDNTSTPLLWYRGLAYFNLQRYDLAFQDFQQAYIVNPYHIHAINNFATCYGLNNEYDKAKKLYEKCNSISPRFEEAALNLALIYSNEQRYEESLDVLLGAKSFENKVSSFPDYYKIESVIEADSLGVANLSDNYMHYFTTIFILFSHDTFHNNKMVNIASDKKKFYSQLKEISFLRREGHTYLEIIKKYEL